MFNIMHKECRGLYIHLHDPPSVVEDSVDNLKRYLFFGAKTYTKRFDDTHCFIMSTEVARQYNQINFFAVSLARSLYPGQEYVNDLYGPVLVLGLNDNYQYVSISYDIINSTLNLMNRFKFDV